MKTTAKLTMVFLIMILFQPGPVQSGKLTITWRYGNPENASWTVVGRNMWQGIDRSCTGPLFGCGKYDWMTTYYYDIQPPALPPAAVSPDYPTEPRITFMQQQGQTPPSTLPEPEITQTLED
jgi:hypothetical protein